MNSVRIQEEARFSIAVERAQLGVWDADIVDGTCYYSPSWKQMLGYEDAELENHPDLWLDFIHPDDRQKAIDNGSSHLEGRTTFVESEFRMRHRDGRWIWMLDRGQVVERDAAGRPTRMIGVQTNITGQKEAASALALLNERVELALATSGIGLWSFEIDTGRTIWDTRMREIYGLGAGPNEVARETWQRRLHPDDAVVAERAANLLVVDGTPVRMTYRIVRPNGDVRQLFAMSRLVSPQEHGRLVVGSIWDVTEQRKTSDALAAERERLRIILRSIGDAVVATDAVGSITFTNKAAERLFDLDRPALLGQAISEVLLLRHEETGTVLGCASEIARQERRTIERREPASFMRHDGVRRSVRDIASPLFDASGDLLGTVLVVQDTTRERARQRELAYLARHDGLTGLLNRTAFDEALQEAIEAEGGAGTSALLYIDLDRFKVVNDTAGHAAGDALLKLVSRAVAEALPKDALIARLGGDEFAVLMTAEGNDDAGRSGTAVVEAISAQRLQWAGQSYGVGASVGIVLLANAGPDAITALSIADAACYSSKSRGRNRVSIHDPVDPRHHGHHGHLAEVRAASDLLQALEEGRLQLHGQEIQSLSSDQPSCRHIEVLSRLVGSDGSLIMPAVFIPAAERFDLMGALDRHVIMLAIDALSGIPDGPEHFVNLSINLSAQSLCDPALWSFVASQLRGSGVPASRLCFEITETTAMNNISAAERFVNDARRAGCRISLDDFGSGLSSFAYLRRFAVDCIKIDGAFVEEVATNKSDQAICRAIGTIAMELGIDVVAERIENAAAITFLKERDIGYGQGFLLHRPEPLSHLLDRWTMRSKQEPAVERSTSVAPQRPAASQKLLTIV